MGVWPKYGQSNSNEYLNLEQSGASTNKGLVRFISVVLILVPSLDLIATMIPIFSDVSCPYPTNTFILSLKLVEESFHCCNPLCYYEINKIFKNLAILKKGKSMT